MNMQFANVDFKDAFPATPDRFNERLSKTLSVLVGESEKRQKPIYVNRVSKPKRVGTKPWVVAASVVLLMGITLGVFMTRPALAAEIPIINDLIYYLSATIEPGAAVQEQAKEAVINTITEFYESGLEKGGATYESGDQWRLNDDTLLMAYYLQYDAIVVGISQNGSILAPFNFDIKDIKMEQKGYKIVANLSYDLSVNDVYKDTKDIEVLLEDTMSGMVITAFRDHSQTFEEYAKGAVLYAQERNLPLKSVMADYNSLLIGKIKTEAYVEERNEVNTNQEKDVGDIAVELRYQFYLAQNTMIMPDLSAIIERNENTELFFNTLEAYIKLRSGTNTPIGEVAPGSFSIKEDEITPDGLRQVHLFVKTSIEGGVNDELILTFRKIDDRYIIIAYDEIGDGFYARMKKQVNSLLESNPQLSLNEANQRAYLDLNEFVDKEIKAGKK